MDHFEQMIKELQSSELPVMIYGAGAEAKTINKFLTESGINAAGFVVDEKYLPQERSLCNRSVYAIEKHLSESVCDLIVGFMGISDRKLEELRNNANIRKVYALDFPGRFVINNDAQYTDEFLRENADVLNDLRNSFSDDASRTAFDLFVSQKNSGVHSKEYSKEPQYFDSEIVPLCENEVLVDCGAYDGDSILSFLRFVDETNKNGGHAGVRKVFAFEADTKNVEMLRENLKFMDDLCIVDKGVYDHTGTLFFSNDNTTNSMISDSGVELPVTTIDEVTDGENVTFIKMDIEGSELKALHGAEKTILRCRPKLAVCVYHKREDLVTIPQYILSLHPDYKLYLRNYSPAGVETVLYAI